MSYFSKFAFVGLSIIAAFGGDCNNGDDIVVSLPGLPTPNNTSPTLQYAGYVSVNPNVNGNIFYWFFSAINPVNSASEIPLLIWLNGGPGASSLNGLYFENGYYQLNDDLSINFRNETWNEKYHMLFIDNPVGSGYSYCNSNGYVTNEDEMGQQFVKAILGFYKCHPEYSSNPLYITGESYAGRYIPFIAKWIVLNTTISQGKIPLKGLAIGDGIYDPFLQFPSAVNYAYNNGILDTFERDNLTSVVNYCLYNLTKISNDTAADLCVNATNDIYSVYGGNIFQYDIRVTNGNAFNELSFTLNTFSNRQDVKEALHTTNHTFNDSDGTSSPNPVYDALKYDIVQNNSAIIVKELLDTGLPILFYNGQFDGSICNNLGVQMCLDQLNYKGIWIEEAVKQPVFLYDPTQNANVTIGYVKVLPSDNQILTYFVVSNSGHLVPLNQPGNSKYMIETWIEGGHWST